MGIIEIHFTAIGSYAGKKLRHLIAASPVKLEDAGLNSEPAHCRHFTGWILLDPVDERTMYVVEQRRMLEHTFEPRQSAVLV